MTRNTQKIKLETAPALTEMLYMGEEYRYNELEFNNLKNLTAALRNYAQGRETAQHIAGIREFGRWRCYKSLYTKILFELIREI